MSKRPFPYTNNERKKTKFCATSTDDDFLLTQNHKSPNEYNDNWGDTNDDDLLLKASQQCEEVFLNDTLSNYSVCMQPASSSTQYVSRPSTSRSDFVFNKPKSYAVKQTSGGCNPISSPIPGMSRIIPKFNENKNKYEDVIVNNGAKGNQDLRSVYQEQIQLQEENSKLKFEIDRLREICMTKEGEASILRTQLKSCEVSLDAAQMDKIKRQDELVVEWNEKLKVKDSKVHELQALLDCKNLEIMSLKTRCKKSDLNISSQRNSSYTQRYTPSKRVNQILSNAVQTDDKMPFFNLNVATKAENSSLGVLLQYILEPPRKQYYSLEYNDKLQKKPADMTQKCQIFSTFHRIPSTPIGKEENRRMFTVADVCQDFSALIAGDQSQDRYFNIFSAVKSALEGTVTTLEAVAQRVTAAFQIEMDAHYLQSSYTYLEVTEEKLLQSSALYKEEQDIPSRRMAALLNCVLGTSVGGKMFQYFESTESISEKPQMIDIISRICVILDITSCAVLYSGLLLAITNTLQHLCNHLNNDSKIIDIIKSISTSRPMPFVIQSLLVLVRSISLWQNFKQSYCPNRSNENINADYDQGDLVYKKDMCCIHRLAKQVEECLQCIENQQLAHAAADITADLIILCYNMEIQYNTNRNRCDCQVSLIQATMFALRLCAVMHTKHNDEHADNSLMRVCRCGIRLLYVTALRDEWSLLGANEGHLVECCDLLLKMDHPDIYDNMLKKLVGTLQMSPEDTPSTSFSQKDDFLITSFQNFSTTN